MDDPGQLRVELFAYTLISANDLFRLVTATCWATKRDMDFEIAYETISGSTVVFIVFDDVANAVHFKLRWGGV